MAQQNPNALYGDFFGGSGQPLPTPVLQAGRTPGYTSPLAPSGYTSPMLGGTQQNATGGSAAAAFGNVGIQRPTSGQFAGQQSPIQNPGNNMTNPGYDEQAYLYTQNRYLEDPAAGMLKDQYGNLQSPTQGEQYLNQNLGTLDGPGQGDQYWNQVQGQYMDPFAGEQYARQATQNFSAQGPASAFYNQSMGQYGDFTGYSGPQNAQGQYGQSAQSLAGGTQGEQGLGQIAGQYGSIGQYGDPNLAAGQYAQTQGAFGAMPIANFDPFYDRARQLGVQSYNQDAAGRGVYGSSEALSGVGNVITDIEAQRANRSFDAEMQRTQEQRARQELLGNQARMGDLSSLAAFGANLSGAETFANINNMQGNLELGRNQLLGNMANNADSQALGAQNANIAGLNAFGNIASSADSAETNRYQASTNAMNNADQTALARMNSGADIAFRGDDSARADFTASTNAANQAAQLGMDRTRTSADIANTMSGNDLNRLNSFNSAASGAEGSRQARMQQTMADVRAHSQQAYQMISDVMKSIQSGEQTDWETEWQSKLLPVMQAADIDQKQIDQLYEAGKALAKAKMGG
jgi:hypothetical protein